MNTFFIIYFLLLATVHLVILFAIWRSIIGKSSIDIKVGTQMSILTKSLDKVGNLINSNGDKQAENAKQLKELTRVISASKNNLDNDV